MLHQIPDAIPGDRNFAYCLAEVEYVDRMAKFWFGSDRSGRCRFILSEVAGLYVSRRPYAYAKSLVALQKSDSSLMRLNSIAVSPHDWAAYRQSDEEDRRVFRSSAFEQKLSPAETSSIGFKARRFDKILQEVAEFFAVHENMGTHLGGVHLELTGQNVTECVGGMMELTDEDFHNRCETHCDPRLNGTSLHGFFFSFFLIVFFTFSLGQPSSVCLLSLRFLMRLFLSSADPSHVLGFPSSGVGPATL